jgi:hypothetical protein
MAAGYQDLYIEQGTTYVTQLTLNDVYGNPYNLAGFVVKSKAKTSYYSSNTVITFNSTVYDANNGIIQLTANADTTSSLNLNGRNLVYDVIITEASSNNVTRVLEGKVIVSPAVTLP